MDTSLIKRIIIFILISTMLCFLEIKAFSYFYVKNDYIIAYLKYTWINIEVFKKIKYYANKHNIDPLFACAVIQRESKGKQKAISKKGARGRFQVMPSHLSESKRQMTYLLYDDDINFNLGCNYLKLCLKKSKGNLIETLRMYNSGMNAKKDKYRNWSYVIDIINDYKDSLKIKETKFASL